MQMLSDFAGFDVIAPVLPELVLAVGALLLLLVGVFMKEGRSGIVAMAGIALLVLVLGLVVFRPAEGVLFNGTFIADGFSRYMKALVVGGSAFTMLISLSTASENGIAKFEYTILVLLATLGMMVMVSANDLMSLYVGLELQSLAAYVIAAMNRDNGRSTEAGLKYFVLGALSSGMLLYGASMVYGFTGTTQLDQIVLALSGENRSIGLVFGMVFLLAGVAFKLSAVPSTCGRPTSMKARRRRSPRSLRRRPRSPPWRCSCGW
jgi:NADH-quinone oxidoreductase subunit N